MRAVARRYIPAALHRDEGAVSWHSVSAGASLPEHDQELAVVGARRERLVWQSGLSLATQEEEEGCATSGADVAPSHWGVRVRASLHFPASATAALSPAALEPAAGTEPPVRGSLAGGGPVLSAAWATFANARAAGAPERQLCVLQRQCLHVVGSEGDVSTVHLPYRARALWVLLEGLLIERAPVDDADLDPDALDESARDPTTGQALVPTLFSLLHPLEELKPVSHMDQTPDVDEEDEQMEEVAQAPPPSLLCDPCEMVVSTCPTQPFVLTFHTQRRVHSLWLIRQSRREVYNRLKLDGNAGASADASLLMHESTSALPAASAAAAGGSASLSVSLHGGAASSSASVAPSSRRGSLGMGWHTPHARQALSPVHHVCAKESDVAISSSPPARPSSSSAADAAAAAGAQGATPDRGVDAGNFYQKFLFANLADEHAHPHVAQSNYHHAAGAAGAGAAGGSAGAHAHAPFDDGQDQCGVIHPELLLERSWTQSSPVSHPCDTVFLSSTQDNEPMLCMFTQATREFHAFLLTSSVSRRAAMGVAGEGAPFGAATAAAAAAAAVPRLHLTPLYSCSFLSVAPLYCAWHHPFSHNLSPYNYAILALEVGGGMALYSGDRRVAAVEVEAVGGKLLTHEHAAHQRHFAGVTKQRGGASLVPATPFKDGTGGADCSFETAVSFEPLDPDSTAAALFLQTPGGALHTAVPSPAQTPLAGGGGNGGGGNGDDIVGLCDAVSNRVTLRLRDGRLYRVALPTSYVSTLVHSCMSSLACTLSTELLCALRADLVMLRTSVWRAEHDAALLSAANGGPVPQAHSQPSEQHEWQAFVILMRHLVGYDSPAPAPSLAASGLPVQGDAAWARLLSSGYHKSRLRNPVLQHLSTSSFALEGTQAAPGAERDDGAPSARLLASLPLTSLETTPALFLAELPALLLCLHLVYEELKLPVVRSVSTSVSGAGGAGVGAGGSPAARWSPPTRLACQVLKPLAVAQARGDYLDAYQREQGHDAGAWVVTERDVSRWGCAAAGVSAEAAAALPVQPPSIHSFLLQRLASTDASAPVYPLPIVPSSSSHGGGHGASSTPAGRGVHNFLLTSSMDEPFAWSRKLLLFYDLLTARETVHDPLSHESHQVSQQQQLLVPSASTSVVVTRATPGEASAAPAGPSTLPSPPARRRVQVVVASDAIRSPYALPCIEARQVELQRSAMAARLWALRGASTAVSTAAPTPAATPAPKPAFFTPHQSPMMSAMSSSTAQLLMLSPLLSPPFPTAMSPFSLGAGAGTGGGGAGVGAGAGLSSRAAQLKRVQAMQLLAVATSAAKAHREASASASALSTPFRLGGGASSDPHEDAGEYDDYLRTPQQQASMGGRGAAKKKNRVSFGVNSTAASPPPAHAHTHAAASSAGMLVPSPSASPSMSFTTAMSSQSLRLNSSTMTASASAAVAAAASTALAFPVFTPTALSRPSSRYLARTAAESVVLAMVGEEFTLDHLALLPFGLALPLWECLKQVRECPPLHLQPGAGVEDDAATAASMPTKHAGSNVVLSMWPREAYALIGREDLGRMFSSLRSGGPVHTTTVAMGSVGGQGDSGSNAAFATGGNGGGGGPMDPDRALDEELEIAAGRPADVELDEAAHGGGGGVGGSSAAARLGAEPPDLDGTLLVQRQAALRFGRDHRLKEVRHLLRSDRILCVSLDASVRQELESGVVGGAEAGAENQARLGIVAKRALAIPIARGMYTLASIQPSLAESLPLPSLVLRGRLPPLNGIIELDLHAQSSVGPQSLAWPEFHNGVAAALRIMPAPQQQTQRGGAEGDHAREHKDGDAQDGVAADPHAELADAAQRHEAPSSGSSSSGAPPLSLDASTHQITRTWIVYNRPTLHSAPGGPGTMVGGLSHAHAGFLFGLGLAGHLGVLSVSDYFWYLSQGHEPTAVAMLLGMAACRRGTCDTTVSKMLTLHIPALLPASFSDMNIPSVVQSSALLGVGLLYQGSAHRLMCEVLLNEIGRRPGSVRADDSFLLERENYALSAGLGLGLLLLAKGGDAAAMSGLADLQLEKKLSTYIHGGRDVPATAGTGSAAGGSAAGGGGGGSGGAGAGGGAEGDDDDGLAGAEWMHSHGPRHAAGDAAGAGGAGAVSSSGGARNAHHAAAVASLSSKNSRIREGSQVNIDVTSPGATLALGLMYLRSNNALIGARLSVPSTHYALDFVRADLIYLRVLAKHLVLWDSIPARSTDQLLRAHLPDLFSEHVLGLRFYMPKWTEPATSKNKAKSAATATAAAAAAAAKKKARQAKAAAAAASARRHDHSDAEEDAEMDEQSGEAFDADEEEEEDEDLDEDDVDSFTGPPVLPRASMGAGADGSVSDDLELGGGGPADVDYATLRQGYIHVISASCFALGLKYAGTADRRVQCMLVRVLKAMRSVAKRRSGGGGDFVVHTMAGLHPAAQLHKVDWATIDASLVAVATALALLMAGSGHLGSLRLFRGLLRQRPDQSTPAGWHSSIAMCVGLLFLGGGRCTIDTGASNPAGLSNLAYLVIAFYPHLAHTLEEQRYYLQIYRHLYVLAVSARGLQTIDVDTGRPCLVPLEVLVQEGEKVLNRPDGASAGASGSGSGTVVPRLKRLRFITPCLLPPYSTIHRISIVSPRFHALSLHLQPEGGGVGGMNPAQLTRIYVKKKLGFESYEKDPRGLRSMLSRTFTTNHRLIAQALGGDAEGAGGGGASSSIAPNQRTEFLRTFSTDPRLLAFAHLFIQDSPHAGSGPGAGPAAALQSECDGSGTALSEYLSAVLYECLQEDKFFETVHVYLQLFPLAHDPPMPRLASSSVSPSSSSSSSPALASLYHRTLESKLADTDLVWSLCVLREYYRSFRPQQQQQQQQVAPMTSTQSQSLAHRSRPVNASTPFHLLPLAEGSASVDLADPDSWSQSGAGDSVAGGGNLNGATPPAVSRPLLALAFLDALLHRVDAFFLQHHSLQRAFAAYVQQLLRSSDAPLPTSAAATRHDGQAQQQQTPASSSHPRAQLTHPLLGSLLIYWQLPSACSLRSGVQWLRRQSSLSALPAAAAAAASARRLVMAGLVWPALPPPAIRAILAAMDATPAS